METEQKNRILLLLSSLGDNCWILAEFVTFEISSKTLDKISVYFSISEIREADKPKVLICSSFITNAV